MSRMKEKQYNKIKIMIKKNNLQKLQMEGTLDEKKKAKGTKKSRRS